MATNDEKSHNRLRDCSNFSSNLEFVTTKELFNSLREASQSLATSYDFLHNQTLQIAALGELESAGEINKLRERLREQDRLTLHGIAELHGILDGLMQRDIFDDLKQRAQTEIEKDIDALVIEEIDKYLQNYMHLDVQDDLVRCQKEIESAEKELHNWESRRLNSNLSAERPDDKLSAVYMSNGEVSKQFPDTLRELFLLDENACEALMHDYDLPCVTNDRDKNLNRLLQFVGVGYQLVWPMALDHLNVLTCTRYNAVFNFSRACTIVLSSLTAIHTITTQTEFTAGH